MFSSPDTNSRSAYDHEPARQVKRENLWQALSNETQDFRAPVRVRSEEHYSCRSFARTIAQISDSFVQSEEHSFLPERGLENHGIRSPRQTLLDNRLCIVPQLYKILAELGRKILVELKFHFARIGMSRS